MKAKTESTTFTIECSTFEIFYIIDSIRFKFLWSFTILFFDVVKYVWLELGMWEYLNQVQMHLLHLNLQSHPISQQLIQTGLTKAY